MVPPNALPVVVALTGASGMPYARRLLEVLAAAGRRIHLVASSAAIQVIAAEMQLDLQADGFDVERFVPGTSEWIEVHHHLDFNAGIASGSYPTAGMIICPCSMGTLGSVAAGAASNLIQRAADVHLKERRPLVLVPRETPLSVIHLENMVRVARAGAVILPPSPGFYHHPKTIDDLVDFVVARICDQLGVAHGLVRPWGATAEDSDA